MVPETDEYTVSVDDATGDVTLTAKPGYEFPGGATSKTFELPADSNEPCVATPPVVEPDDECGPDNAAYPAIPETNQYTVTVNEDGSVTLTAKDGWAFEGPSSTYELPAPVDSGEECPVDEKKVVVCKYVGTPPGVPDHIIVVSEAAALADGWDGVSFPGTFADAHDSIVLRWAVGNEQPGDEELVNCPLAEATPPSVEPNDPCGPDNIAFPAVPETDEYTVEVVDGDVVLTAKPGYEFPGGEPTLTLELPADSGEECPEVGALASCVTTIDPDLPVEDARLVAKADGVVIEIIDEVFAEANGFLGTLPFTFILDGREYTVFAVAEPGQTADDFSVDVECAGGEVIDDDCLDAATNPDAVDANGEPCNPDGGETGGIVDTDDPDALPNTGGPAGWLMPLGVGLVLAGAGLVLSRRTRSA